MPNYNSNYLKRSIQSVINQNFENWELIVVDNYSSNFPEKIIEEFKNHKIRFFRFNNNNNIGKSRNFGIKKANFEWIAFLDSDDVWEKDKLIKVNDTIKLSKSDLIYHGMYYLPKKFGFIKQIIKNKSSSINEPIYQNLLKYGNPIANSSVVIRKKKLAEIGFISEHDEKYSWEDYECWIRLSSRNNKFFFINQILGYCWVGQGRVSNVHQSYKNCKNFMKFYRKEIAKINENKKRPVWISIMYSNFFFKKKNYLRSYFFLKDYNGLQIQLLLKKLYSSFILFCLNKIKKNLFILIKNLRKFFNKVIIYKFDNEKVSQTETFENLDNFQFHVFEKYKEFRICENFFYSFDNKIFLKRFEKKHKLLTLIDKKSKKIVCYGWCSNNAIHNVDEINKKIYFKNGNILYDFFTLNEYRNKKLYKYLLYQISLNLKKPLYIYSLSSNKKSLNAIIRTGFYSIKNLNFFSDNVL